MKAKFSVSSGLNGQSGGIENIRTPLLMLTKVTGLALGPGPDTIDRSLDGRLSAKMKARDFKGELGETITLKLGADATQQNVVLVGIGSAAKFDNRALCRIVRLVVDRAIKLGVGKISIPIAPNRMTQFNLNLRGTAHIIREIVEQKLADESLPKDGVLEVELVASPQAKRHLEAGLAIPLRHQSPCCQVGKKK